MISTVLETVRMHIVLNLNISNSKNADDIYRSPHTSKPATRAHINIQETHTVGHFICTPINEYAKAL